MDRDEKLRELENDLIRTQAQLNRLIEITNTLAANILTLIEIYNDENVTGENQANSSARP